MATISFTVNNTISQRLLDSFCASYGFTGTNSEKTAFLKARTVDFWKDRIKQSENLPIADAAIQTNNQQINNLDIT